MPLTNALGETNQFDHKKPPRDPETNKPFTAPRNFYTNKGKTGINDEVYIGANMKDFKSKMPQTAKEIYVAKAAYNCIGDKWSGK